MKNHHESWDDVVSVSPFDFDSSRRFDNGYGMSEGKPFTIWTTNRVYFPVVYDGSEWAGSVTRNPCPEVTEHLGGE
jgi:hypothetical protein